MSIWVRGPQSPLCHCTCTGPRAGSSWPSSLLHWEPLQDKAAHVSSLSLDDRKELGSVSIGGVGLVLEGRDVGAEGIDSGVTLTGAGILALPLTHCVTPRRLPNTSEPSPEKVGD